MDDLSKLKKLKEIYEAGLITKEEYDAKKKPIVDNMVNSAGTSPSTSRATSVSSVPKSPRATGLEGSSGSISPRKGSNPTPINTSSGNISPRRTTASSPRPSATSPRRTEAASPTNLGSPRDAQSGISPRPKTPPPKFDVNMPYDPKNVKKQAKDDAHKPTIPVPEKGTSGQRIEMPAGLKAFTSLKVVQEPEKQKIGVYLGPSGKSGGVYSSQHDVRRMQTIGAPEVSTTGHIGSSAKYVTSWVGTAGNVKFEAKVFVNTSCLDLISICVKGLGLPYPPSHFCMILSSKGDTFIAPEKLVFDQCKEGAQWRVMPKESAPEDCRRAYLSKVNPAPPPDSYQDSNFSQDDVEAAPNQGKQLYYAY